MVSRSKWRFELVDCKGNFHTVHFALALRQLGRKERTIRKSEENTRRKRRNLRTNSRLFDKLKENEKIR